MKRRIQFSSSLWVLALLLIATQQAFTHASPVRTVPPASGADSTKSTGNTFASVEKPVFLKRLVEPEFVVGTSTVAFKTDPLENWLSGDSKFTGLGQLKAPGSATTLLVFGDGLAAGWKDGGLYRQGQQFAFPNLVARQIGLRDFDSPLFDPAHSNGTGFLKLEPGTAAGPRWKEVANDLAILPASNVPELVPYTGEEVENFAAPKLDRAGIGGTLSPSENGWIYDDLGRGFTDDMVFLWRLKPRENRYRYTYLDLMDENLQSRRPAIVLSVFGYDGWMDQNVKSNNVFMSWPHASSESSPLAVTIAKRAKAAGAKGVVFTIPDFRHLPYFNWFTQQKLNQTKAKVTINRRREGILGTETITGDMIFLPTKNTELLFEYAKKGGSFEFTLEDSDVADAREILGGSPDAVNARIKREAQENGLLVVDLAALYEKVHLGGYRTADGYSVSGGVGGNFFSDDGLYPSTLGHAVIANETIKVLNEGFGAQIPLIDVTEFAGYLNK
ncbi:hypothetical protein [Salmonirosea aquatica]|uniref:SGNH/GDSL hydrolase family protein n=1 Tax=Salmonirosea aquatica TaxID=2654236 RepID=A0A7C9BEG0_9BACT|nr:hypothetical protein [Cytophagaceae bacterium SJW1-29]